MVGDWFNFFDTTARQSPRHELETLKEREHFPGLCFYGATVLTASGPEPGDSIIVLSGRVRGNFMLPLKLLGGSPLCLAVSPGAAAQGSGLLTLLCTPGEPELAILGNSILILVKIERMLGFLLVLSVPL